MQKYKITKYKNTKIQKQRNTIEDIWQAEGYVPHRKVIQPTLRTDSQPLLVNCFP